MDKISSSRRKFTRLQKIYTLILLTAVFLPFLPTYRVSAAAGISGRVFQDFNGNGIYDTAGSVSLPAIDVGMANVTVTAYDPSGINRGSVTTIADGTYNLAATGTGPYRVEFTNLPSGYFPSARSTDSILGGSATNSGSTVQFVNNGGTTTNVNLALNRPSDYSQNNPDVAISQYYVGNVDGGSILRFPYNYSSELDGNPGGTWTSAPSRTSSLNPAQVAANNNIGTAYGIAWNRNTKNLYFSAFIKRGTKLGTLSNESTGAIFVKNNPSATTPAPTVYVDLNTVFGADTAGANPHPIATTDWTSLSPDPETTQHVSKRGLGDLEISQDGSLLYTVNLADRQLYVIPTSGTLNSTTITRFPVPTSGLATASGNCPTVDVRPFGLGRDANGQIYVGAVCSGESTSNSSQVHAYVWRFNSGGTFTLVVNTTLSGFTRRLNATDTVTWEHWANIDNIINRASPILADIDFDRGDMLLGIRDRYADQVVFPDFYRGYGDIMRACANGATWSVESNGSCGGVTTTGVNTSGLGGGEFYIDLNGDGRDEGGLGALLQVPGFNHLMTTFYDPVTYNSSGTRVSNFYTSGVQTYNNTTGVMSGAYDVYLDGDANNFGKANGIGDIEALSDAAPIEVGNRVWNDTNNNGIQDANENFIANVDVELWADTDSNGSIDTRVGQTQTDTVSGEYYFGGAANLNMLTYSCSSSLQVNSQVNASANDAYETSAGVILNGGTNRLTRGFGTLAGDNFSGVRFANVAIPQGATITNAYLQFTANDTIGSNTGSPTVLIQGEASDNSAAYTTTAFNVSGRADTTSSVNWAVPTWASANESGANQRTPNLISIVQEIVNRPGWASGNAMSFTVSGGGATTRRDWETFDGNAGNATRLFVEYTVSSSCPYTLNSNTNYQVRIPSSEFGSGQPLFNLFPTNDNADASANGDSRDSDGSAVSGGNVVVNFNSGNPGNNNHSFDFGFSPTSSYSLGNRVWFDTNNNGIIDPQEFGISGVSLSLFADSDCNNSPDNLSSPLQSLLSDSNGYYRFDSLSAGCYFVRVNPSNFSSGSLLEEYQNTTGFNPADLESFGSLSNAENGVDPSSLLGNNPASKRFTGILSNMITLSGTSEPLNEADVPSSGTFAGQGSFDNQADMTVDFGFYELCLCGTLWSDTGAGVGQTDNGILDAGEAVIPGMRVQLYDGSGNEVFVGEDGILGTADDAPGGILSGGAGNYNFRGLPEGQYRVVVQSAGAVSSTFNDGDTNIDNNDNGSPGSGSFNGRTVSVIITLTPGGEPLINNPDGTTANTTVDFGFIVGPSAVVLDSYRVDTDGEQTVISWSTSQELNNLGFNVYRILDGKREKLNQSLISGSALRDKGYLQATGESYSLTVKEVSRDAVYELEDIDLEGVTTSHGVTAAINGDVSRLKLGRSVQVSELTKADETAEQSEKVILEENQEKTQVSRRKTSQSAKQAKQFEIAKSGGVRILIREAGWYEVSPEELLSAGFEINEMRENWQLFNQAEEIPIQVKETGAIRFYGKGVDKLTTATNVYYLVKGKSLGERIREKEEVEEVENPLSEEYLTEVERKEKKIYTTVILNGEEENWYGPVVNSLNETIQELNLGKTAVASNQRGRVSVKLQGLVNSSHRVLVKLNGRSLGEISYQGQTSGEREFEVEASELREGMNQISLQSLNGTTDISLVNSVKIRYAKKYEAENNLLRFSAKAGETVKVKGFSRPEIEVVELEKGIGRGLLKVRGRESGEGYEIRINGEGKEGEKLAVGMDEVKRAEKVERNENSELNRSENRGTVIIISNRELRGSAERLAVMKEEKGLKAKIVMTEDIMDEFSYGIYEPEGVKEFLRRAKESWSGKPEYVILLGDTSYDPKGYSGQERRETVPGKILDAVYMETMSDSWLTDFNGDDIEDIALGRLPAANEAEAESILNKLERYERQEAGSIRKQVLIADRDFEGYTQALEGQLPIEVEKERINRASLTDAEFRGRILSSLNSGAEVVTYKGHGSTGVWTNASSLRMADAGNLRNEKLSLYLLMTCMNGYIQNPYGDSLGEALLRNAEGGGIGVWASSGATTPNGQYEIVREMNRLIYEGGGRKPRTLGEMSRLAKGATNDRTVRKTWLLIGDPTLRLK